MSQSLFVLFAYGCFFIALALGVLLYRRLVTWTVLDRLLVGTLPVTILILLELMLREWLSQASWPLNASRLALTFSLVHGYQMYYGADSGPVLSTIYGPITALVYLPSTVASSPTAAILLASLIALICFFLPILWLFLAQATTRQAVLFRLYTFIGFCFFTLSSDSLASSAFRIHADAPALGLSLAACTVLYCRENKDNWLTLLLSATFAILAIWTKQVTFPILFALPIYLLLTQGWKVTKNYILCLIVIGLVISSILLLVFNPELIWFNIIKVPAGNPWTSDNKMAALLGTMRISLQKSLAPLTVILFYTLYQVVFATKRSLKTWLGQNPWTIVFCVGLFIFPISLLGYVKQGGDPLIHLVLAFTFLL